MMGVPNLPFLNSDTVISIADSSKNSLTLVRPPSITSSNKPECFINLSDEFNNVTLTVKVHSLILTELKLGYNALLSGIK